MADWKGGRGRRDPNPVSKPSPKRAAEPARGGGAWRGRGGRTGSQGGDWGLWLKRLLTSGLVLAVLGTLVAILWLYQVPTRVVVLATQSYPSDTSYAFPARPGGGIPRFSGARTYLTFLGNENGEEASLTNQLGNIANGKISFGGPEKNVILISINAQGLVNQNGEPCLLDRKSEPFDDKTWTTFESIFSQLREKIDTKKTNRHVVVFIDSGTAETDWSIGLLKDDFRERLREIVERSDKRFLPDRWHLIHVRGLTDLTTFANTGRRVHFADILDCGLRGGADRNNDQKVSLVEMKNYIESKTGTAPDVFPTSPPKTQKPADANPSLCWAERNKQKPEPPKFAASRAFERLKPDLERLWTDHLALDGEKPWRFFPWDWARFEHQLLRAERAVMAGDEELAKQSLQLARRQHDNLKDKARKQRERQDQFTAPPMTFDASEGKAILGSTEALELPVASGRMSPVTALACLLKRDVMGSADSIAATQIRSNSFALTELLALRVAAEESVWPTNFRAESLLRNQADAKNDKQRLTLEDVAFIGGKQQLDSLPDHARKARADYEASAKLASDFAIAFEQRDELLAKLPWALRWAELKQSKSHQDDLMSLWKETVEKLRIFESPVNDRDAVVDIEGWKEISSRFDKYLKLSDEARKHQEDDKWLSSPREWVRGAIPFFATPLVSDQRRRELRTRLIEVLNNSNATEKVDQEASKESTEELPFARWETHPLRALFAHSDVGLRGDGAPGLGLFPSIDKLTAGEFKPTDNWAAGATVRGEYLTLPDKTTWSAVYSKQIMSREELIKHYRELIAYDELGRSQAVALCAGNELKHSSPQNVISRLDQLHFAMYYDWRVARSLGDFYGPTNVSTSTGGTTNFRDAYFHVQASEWVKKLESLTGDGRPFGQLLADQWKGVLESLSKSNSPSLSLEINRKEVIFPPIDPEPQSIKVTVKAEPVPGIHVDGTTALECPKYTPDSGNQTRDRRPAPLGWAMASRPSSTTEDVKLAAGNETLPIRAYFRGHVAKEATVNLVREKPKESIDREIPVYETPSLNSSVMVKGIAPQRLWIMVILDCSDSMREEMPTVEDSSRLEPRFTVATRALKSMLNSLLNESRDQQTDLHVGLMAYGYRSGIVRWKDERTSVGFADPKSRAKLQQPPVDDEDTDPDDRVVNLRNLDPSLDVGILVPLIGGPKWGQSSFDRMSNLIDRRIPIGNTPLYLSIVKAANHMQSLPAEDQKWIVVLTDGVDNQETLSMSLNDRAAWKLVGVPQDKTGESEAEKAIQGQSQLHIRIVGIGLPDKATAKAAVEKKKDPAKNALIVSGLDSLERFCASKKDIDGRPMRELIFTQNGEELAKQLTVHIPPVSFRAVQKVPESDLRVIPSEKLGNRLELKNSEGKEYQVEVLRGEGESATVLANSNLLHMYGGERFEMVFTNSSKKLLFHRGWESIKNNSAGVAADQNALVGNMGVANRSRDVIEFVNQSGERWQAALIGSQRSVVNNRPSRQFRLAFRPVNETTSPARPIFLRAVITPLINNQPVPDTTPFYFESHDIRHVINQPLPVVEFEATDWKNEWKQANLTVWLRAPGDDAQKSDDIEISKSVLDEAGSDLVVPLPGLGGHLKIKIEKEVRNTANGNVSLQIQQTWGTGSRPKDIEDLPILQVFPPPKGCFRSIQLDQEHLGYRFLFPGESERTKAYQLRVLDPTTLPHTRALEDAKEPPNVVKKLWWEKIIVE